MAPKLNALQFWILIGMLLVAITINGGVAYEAVSQNRESIRSLQAERYEDEQYVRSMLVRIEENSRLTSEKVVDALTGLTDVIGKRFENDQRMLNLLETIQNLIKGESNVK